MGKTKKEGNGKGKIVDRIKSGSHSLNPGFLINQKFTEIIGTLFYLVSFLIWKKNITNKIAQMAKAEIICVQRRPSIAWTCTKTLNLFVTDLVRL